MATLVRGTADWQLDLMKEMEDERAWEAQKSAEWDRMLDSVGYMNVAIEHMEKATESMQGATEAVKDLNCDYKVLSILERLEDLTCELEQLRKNFINGEG